MAAANIPWTIFGAMSISCARAVRVAPSKVDIASVILYTTAKTHGWRAVRNPSRHSYARIRKLLVHSMKRFDLPK
jgi:hypothetical protein